MRKVDLTQGGVIRHLARMGVPMIGGILAMSLFNLTDTWFVARLGKDAMAAMSFTFPVVMIVGSVAMGLGIGASSVISRAIGAKDYEHVPRLATHAMILTVLMVAVFATVGLLTMGPLFRAMGATDAILALVHKYMTVWYACVAVLIVPMVGNNCIRATGDTVTPSVIMIISAGLNVILDPLFIFGIGWFPRMELTGAAVATVISRLCGLVASLLFLHFRFRMIHFARLRFSELWDSWKRILEVALPNAAANMLNPVSRGILTRLVAAFGTASIAAFGAGSRIEMLALTIPIAFGMALVPFVGQNWGAGRFDRVRKARRIDMVFSTGWGIFTVLFFLLAGGPIARFFTKDPDIVAPLVLYLVIVCIGHAGQHICAHTTFMMNAAGKPISASVISVMRTFAFVIPCGWVGSMYGGYKGLLWGVAIGQLLSGAGAILWSRYVLDLKRRIASMAEPESAFGQVESDLVGAERE